MTFFAIHTVIESSPYSWMRQEGDITSRPRQPFPDAKTSPFPVQRFTFPPSTTLFTLNVVPSGDQEVDPVELLHLNKIERLIYSTAEDWDEYTIAPDAAGAIEQEGATGVHFQRSELLGSLSAFRAVYESTYPVDSWMKAFGNPFWMIPHHLKVHGKESDPIVYVGDMKIGYSGEDNRGFYVDVLYRLTVKLLGFKDRFFVHRYRIRPHPVVPGGKILEWTNVEHFYLDTLEGEKTIKTGIRQKTSQEFYDLLASSIAEAVHPQKNMGAYEVVPLENGRYRVIQYYWADFGGRVPDKISAFLTKSSFPKLVARNFQIVRKVPGKQ